MLQLTLLPKDLKLLQQARQDLILTVAESAFSITSGTQEELLALKVLQGKLQLLTELISNVLPINHLEG
jgi:hypothetical protein